MPNVNAVIRKNLKHLYSEPENKKIFSKTSNNLKEILVPTKLPKIEETSSQKSDNHGCFKCSAKICDICQNHLKETKRFASIVTKNSYPIKHRLSCNQVNCIYLITCKKCKLQYVGSTVYFKARWRRHKSHIKHNKTTSCRVARHWCGNHRDLKDLEIIIIEQVFGEKAVIDSLLLTRESLW